MLYRLNLFRNGSASLVIESASERSSLVATALVKRTKSLQTISLLLSDHMDTLCEFIEDLNKDGSVIAGYASEASTLAPSSSPASSRSKNSTRKRRGQKPRATKKAAQSTT